MRISQPLDCPQSLVEINIISRESTRRKESYDTNLPYTHHMSSSIHIAHMFVLHTIVYLLQKRKLKKITPTNELKSHESSILFDVISSNPEIPPSLHHPPPPFTSGKTQFTIIRAMKLQTMPAVSIGRCPICGNERENHPPLKSRLRLPTTVLAELIPLQISPLSVFPLSRVPITVIFDE